MGPDKKRLSKRHGATSVMEYQRLGYLPEAMVNFLALLGWSPGGDREVLSRDELKQLFTLEGISGGNAVFNAEKLDWFNQQHIGRLPGDDLLRGIEGAAAGRRAVARHAAPRRVRVDREGPRSAEAARPRTLDQLVDEMRPFLVDQPGDRPRGGGEASDGGDPAACWRSWPRRMDGLEPSRCRRPSSRRCAATAEQAGIKAAALIHATRVAVTGRAVSAGTLRSARPAGPRHGSSARLRRAVNYTPPA